MAAATTDAYHNRKAQSMPGFPGCAIVASIATFWTALLVSSTLPTIAMCAVWATGVFIAGLSLPWIAEGVERGVNLVRGWFA